MELLLGSGLSMLLRDGSSTAELTYWSWCSPESIDAPVDGRAGCGLCAGAAWEITVVAKLNVVAAGDGTAAGISSRAFSAFIDAVALRLAGIAIFAV